MKKVIVLVGLLLFFAVAMGCCEPIKPLEITHGVAVGEVSSNSACIWSRANRAGVMHVTIMPDQKPGELHRLSAEVRAEDDFTGKVLVENLHPETMYFYRVHFTDKKGKEKTKKVAGYFRTAPSRDKKKPVSFVWSGDLGGQNVGRDEKEGYAIFKTWNGLEMDFFIALGDMIYADNPISDKGKYGNKQIPGPSKKAVNLSEYWQYWKYNREDSHFQEFLSSVPFYAIWDDHEVINDFGPLHDKGEGEPYPKELHLMPVGLDAFFDYNPIPQSIETPNRMYRTLRWGKHLEVFFLDNRQYRDANLQKSTEQYPKTMLGREQLTWLKHRLQSSDATWKVIVSSVPISIPTGYPPTKGRDGWANYDQQTGFEHELQEIFTFMRKNNIRNNVWITTDVHFVSVFRYIPFDDDKEFTINEFVVGPMSAGLYPLRAYDKTFHPSRLFFYGPASMNEPLTYRQARKFMNYGMISIDNEGDMAVTVHDIDGKTLYTQELKRASKK